MDLTLPASVRVGALTYAVFSEEGSWEALRDKEKLPDGQVGYSNHHTLTIHLDPALALSQKADTLWHEVLHCVLRWGSLSELLDEVKRRTDADELIVRTLTPILLLVLRDNPSLLRWLTEATSL